MTTFRLGKTIRALVATALICGAASCATRDSVFSDYYATLREVPQAKGDRRTVVLFLVDGLGSDVFRSEQGNLPGIRGHFESREGGRAYLGRASFPTLTYPNISSILTASPVGAHPVTGNLVRNGREVVSYEKPWNAGKLNDALRGQTVFTSVGRHGGNSVSLSYYFRDGATARFGDDIKTGVAYLGENYRYIDRKTLGALDGLLDRTAPSKWPEFVFVHLIGYDSLAHEYGPGSSQAREYLRELDAGMKRVLDRLAAAEKAGKEVVTFLTADHGFIPVKRFSDVESFVRKADPEIQVLNQARLASLYFPESWTRKGQAVLLASVRRSAGVELTVQKLEPGTLYLQTAADSAWIRLRPGFCVDAPFEMSVEVDRRRGHAVVPITSPYECPSRLEAAYRGLRPDLFAAIGRYFLAKGSPDALLLAANETSFLRGSLGTHGGASERESDVPVLVRNARFESPREAIPTYALLAFLKKERKPRAQQLAGEASYSAIEGESVLRVRPEEGATVAAPVQFGLRLSTPTRVSTLSFAPSDDSSADSVNLRSPFSPGLSAELDQYWSATAASFVSYRITAVNYGSGNTGAPQEFRVGAGYRFGDRDILYGAFGLSQEFFSPAPDPSSVRKLVKLTIPELSFGTRSRIYSIGFGDLALQGRLSVLFAKSDQGVDAAVGFKQFAGISFEHPVATTDLAGGELGYEHFSQGTQSLARSGWSLVLGAFYGLSFQ
jgi:hypothetical protein